jgi:hypothetical protein
MSHDLLTYQVIILIIAGLLILRKFVMLLRRKVGFREFVLAALIWGAFAAFSLFPNVITLIGHALGFELGINALLVITTLILFYIVLMLLIKIDRVDQNLTKLVRAEALKQLKQRLTNN